MYSSTFLKIAIVLQNVAKICTFDFITQSIKKDIVPKDWDLIKLVILLLHPGHSLMKLAYLFIFTASV